MELSLKQRVGFIGIGGCGTNIANKFYEKGYEALFVNSSAQDEAALKNINDKVLHLDGFNGCAGDRDKALLAIKKNKSVYDKIVSMEQDVLFLCFGAGGGTGSGITPILADLLDGDTEKTICVICALPDDKEDLSYQINAYNCTQELLKLKNIGCTIFIDNNKRAKKSELNEEIAYLLDTFISNDSSSLYGNVDVEERLTVLKTNGNMLITVGEENTQTIIAKLTSDTIFAPIDRSKPCEYISIINKKHDDIDKAKLIEFVGIPIRTNLGYGADKTIVVVSGLSYPIEHLKSIGAIATSINDKRNSADKGAVMDDLNINIKKNENEHEHKGNSNPRDFFF